MSYEINDCMNRKGVRNLNLISSDLWPLLENKVILYEIHLCTTLRPYHHHHRVFVALSIRSPSNSKTREDNYVTVHNRVRGQWVMWRSGVVTAPSNYRFVGDRQRESIEPNS